MDTLEVSLFGGFQLRRGERSVPPMPSRAARSLFAYLAVDPGTRHPRERLAASFWPDLDPGRARRRLSHTLWQVQDALHELEGEASYLEVTADTLAFAPDAPFTVDVAEFEAGLERARARRGAETDRVRDLTDLEATVERYRGEFLAGHTDAWVAEVQERLHLAYVEALGWLVGLAKSHGAFDDALVYARRLTNEDRLREDGHREVMRLSVLLGRPSDALRQYERCREVLAEELGTEPSAATRDLHARIERQQRLTGLVPTTPAVDGGTATDQVPLVGRDRERDAAVAILERALAGRGGALFVEGDPGVGTSRLLAEVVDDAGWRAFATVEVSCPTPERAVPYGLVCALLESSLTSIRLEQLRPRVAPVWMAAAATLVPVLGRAVPAERPPSWARRSEDGAQRMRDALTQVLLGLAAIEPLAMVVDDAHWCDVESLAVLEAVADHLAEHRAVLVLGYRGDEARGVPAVWSALRAIDRRARPERLLLEPLDTFSTGELVRLLARGRVVVPEAIGRLQRETGGNPLFVVETVRALGEDGGLHTLEDGSDGEGLRVTGSIRALALQRLDRLPAEVREVLDVAAVAGGKLDLAVLTAAAELPRPAVVDAASALVRRSLWSETSEAFTFRHDLVRRVAVDALSPGGRRALHLRVAEVLEQREPDAVERLAHHFLHAELPHRAVGYLHHAGRNAAAVHAYATADERYRQAITLAAQRPESIHRRFEVLAEHEAVLDVLGERERQRERLEELAILAEASREREVEVARRRALLSGHLGDLPVGLQAAQQAVAGAVALGDAALLGPALLAQASVLAWAGRRAEAVPVLEHAVALAEGADGGDIRAMGLQAQVQLGSVLRELQRFPEAREVLDAALERAEHQGATREEAGALGVLGSIRMETGDSEAAEALYGRAIDRSRAIGFRRGEGVHLLNRAITRWARNTLTLALADFEAAAATFASLRDRRGEAAVRSNLGFALHVVLGDDLAARVELEHALAYFREIGDDMFVAQCLDTLASMALRAGDTVEAGRHLEEAGALLSGDEAGTVWSRTHLLRRRAELAMAEGEAPRSDALLREALALAVEHGLRDLLPVLQGLHGETLLALGRPDAALRATTEAEATLQAGVERAYVVRFQHALALEVDGQAQAAADMVERAGAELEALLAHVEPTARARALTLPEHRRIREAVARARSRRTTITVARADAPSGRALAPAELVEVTVDRGRRDDDPDDPVTARRRRLARIVDAIRDQGGAPTVGDLSQVLEVSAVTIRRDIEVLRDHGVAVATRGHRAG